MFAANQTCLASCAYAEYLHSNLVLLDGCDISINIRLQLLFVASHPQTLLAVKKERCESECEQVKLQLRSLTWCFFRWCFYIWFVYLWICVYIYIYMYSYIPYIPSFVCNSESWLLCFKCLAVANECLLVRTRCPALVDAHAGGHVVATFWHLLLLHVPVGRVPLLGRPQLWEQCRLTAVGAFSMHRRRRYLWLFHFRVCAPSFL